MIDNVEDLERPDKILETFIFILLLSFCIWILQGYTYNINHVSEIKERLKFDCKQSVPEMKDVPIERIEIGRYTYNSITRKIYNVTCYERIMVDVKDINLESIVEGME